VDKHNLLYTKTHAIGRRIVITVPTTRTTVIKEYKKTFLNRKLHTLKILTRCRELAVTYTDGASVPYAYIYVACVNT